jgi:hypothetical protein
MGRPNRPPRSPDNDPVLAEIMRYRPEGRPEEGYTWAAIGAHLGITGALAQQIMGRYLATLGKIPEVYRGRPGPIGRSAPEKAAPAQPEAKPASTTEAVATWTGLADGSAVIESGKGLRIRTLEQLLGACEVDLGRWEVKRHVVNKWDNVMRSADNEPVITELFQVKAWLEPLKGVDTAREIIAGLIADMASHAPAYGPLAYPDGDPLRVYMLELDPFDLHVGMLAWAEETGEDYDSAIATSLAERATVRLLQLAAGFRFERVLIPLGNDLLHTDRMLDGKGGQTARGTAQDVDTRRGKMTRAGIQLAIRLIDMARELAPVEVVIIPGNHDTETMPMLGEVLAAWYRLDDAVTVRNSPAPRQLVTYGASILGLCHGHEGKTSELPLIMAAEWPAEYAAATHRAWHIGHLHREGEWVEEHGRVRVCTLPSLAARDSWHALKGYGHVRAMKAHVWHRDHGPVAQFTASVPGLSDERKAV